MAMDSADERIALMPCKHGQQYRPQHIALARGIGAFIGSRTCVNPWLKEFSRFQKIDKRRQLAHRGFLCLGFPSSVYASSKGFDKQRSRSGYIAFTHRVDRFAFFSALMAFLHTDFHELSEGQLPDLGLLFTREYFGAAVCLNLFLLRTGIWNSLV